MGSNEVGKLGGKDKRKSFYTERTEDTEFTEKREKDNAEYAETRREDGHDVSCPYKGGWDYGILSRLCMT